MTNLWGKKDFAKDIMKYGNQSFIIVNYQR